jgi:aminopeptidase N
MENWGLIIYKETNLIGDENSHHYDFLRILQVVAHELGHQFFGNLVTLEWWNYTWLNEGFATLFEYLLVENVYPNYRIRDFFNVVKVHNSMVIDSVESTHPLTYAGSTIGQIIYDKGEFNDVQSELILSRLVLFKLQASSECSKTPWAKTFFETA